MERASPFGDALFVITTSWKACRTGAVGQTFQSVPSKSDETLSYLGSQRRQAGKPVVRRLGPRGAKVKRPDDLSICFWDSMEPPIGVEPTTFRLRIECSTN